MIIDTLATFCDALTGTTSAAATDVIDLGAAADAYESSWLNIRVDTAYTAASGTPTATFQLQTASNTDFLAPDAVTLAASDALGTSSLVASAYVWQIRIPKGCKRYLRVYKVVSSPNNNFSAGAYDAFITKDIDMNTVKVRA